MSHFINPLPKFGLSAPDDAIDLSNWDSRPRSGVAEGTYGLASTGQAYRFKKYLEPYEGVSGEWIRADVYEYLNDQVIWDTGALLGTESSEPADWSGTDITYDGGFVRVNSGSSNNLYYQGANTSPFKTGSQFTSSSYYFCGYIRSPFTGSFPTSGDRMYDGGLIVAYSGEQGDNTVFSYAPRGNSNNGYKPAFGWSSNESGQRFSGETDQFLDNFVWMEMFFPQLGVDDSAGGFVWLNQGTSVQASIFGEVASTTTSGLTWETRFSNGIDAAADTALDIKEISLFYSRPTIIDLTDWENRPTDGVSEGDYGQSVSGSLYRFQADAQEWVRNEVYNRVVEQEGQTYKASYGFTGAESSTPSGWGVAGVPGQIEYNPLATPPYIAVSSSVGNTAALRRALAPGAQDNTANASYACGYVWVEEVGTTYAQCVNLLGRGQNNYLWGATDDGSFSFGNSPSILTETGQSYASYPSGTWHWFEIYQTEQIPASGTSNQFNWIDFGPSLASAWDNDVNLGGNIELFVGSTVNVSSGSFRFRDFKYIEWEK